MTIMQVPQPDEAGYWLIPPWGEGEDWVTAYADGLVWGDHCPLMCRLHGRGDVPEWIIAAFDEEVRVVWTLRVKEKPCISTDEIYDQKVELAFKNATDAMLFKMKWF